MPTEYILKRGFNIYNQNHTYDGNSRLIYYVIPFLSIEFNIVPKEKVSIIITRVGWGNYVMEFSF